MVKLNRCIFQLNMMNYWKNIDIWDKVSNNREKIMITNPFSMKT